MEADVSLVVVQAVAGIAVEREVVAAGAANSPAGQRTMPWDCDRMLSPVIRLPSLDDPALETLLDQCCVA